MMQFIATSVYSEKRSMRVVRFFDSALSVTLIPTSCWIRSSLALGSVQGTNTAAADALFVLNKIMRT